MAKPRKQDSYLHRDAEASTSLTTLKGLIEGVQCDCEINMFPYDEIYSIVCQIGTRRLITHEEKSFLVRAFKWTNQESALKNSPFFPWEIDPTIEFPCREFCISGVSKFGTRKEIEEAIRSKSGVTVDRVTKNLSYLVVCSEPNRAWTHACYGRKIEQAVKLRKLGTPLTIVSEGDLWDSLRD